MKVGGGSHPSVAGAANALAGKSSTREARAAVKDTETGHLHALDEEMARRATLLGKKGQVSKAHKAVKDELRSRNASALGDLVGEEFAPEVWAELTRIVLSPNPLGELAVSGLQTSPQGRKLWKYWVHGEGAAKIGWGGPDDFDHCVVELAKYVGPGQVKGLCATMHKAATGMSTAEHAKLLGGKH